MLFNARYLISVLIYPFATSQRCYSNILKALSEFFSQFYYN